MHDNVTRSMVVVVALKSKVAEVVLVVGEIVKVSSI